MQQVRQPAGEVANTGAGGQDPNRGRGNRRPWRGPAQGKKKVSLNT